MTTVTIDGVLRREIVCVECHCIFTQSIEGRVALRCNTCRKKHLLSLQHKYYRQRQERKHQVVAS